MVNSTGAGVVGMSDADMVMIINKIIKTLVQMRESIKENKPDKDYAKIYFYDLHSAFVESSARFNDFLEAELKRNSKTIIEVPH